MPRRIVSALLMAFLVLSVAGAAEAQDARALFTQGQAAYETGDYQTAVDLWERAYGLDARPLLQYNLAQAYERLGQLDRAVTAYRLYVEHTPGEDERARNARARILSLEARVGQTSINLTGGPEGAQITIDGEDRGRLPHPDALHVDPGNHRVVIRADGYEDFVSSVAVSAGQQAALSVEMRAGTSGSAPDTVGGGGGMWMPGLIIAGGGAAVAIVGAIVGGLALGAAGDAPNATGPEADDARTLALVADILIPTGIVVAAAGVVLAFVLPSGDDGESATLVPLVGPDMVGLAAYGQF